MTKNYLLTCSKDGINIDFETTIKAIQEPDFWTCYDIAMSHGCEFFDVCEAN